MPKGFQIALEEDEWPSAAGSIVWLVHSSDGWIKVRAEHAEAIEAGVAANRNPVECRHTYPGKGGQKTTSYQYDWQAMTQRNPQSGTERALIRARYYPAPPNPPSAAGGPEAGGAAGGTWGAWKASGASGAGGSGMRWQDTTTPASWKNSPWDRGGSWAAGGASDYRASGSGASGSGAAWWGGPPSAE